VPVTAATTWSAGVPVGEPVLEGALRDGLALVEERLREAVTQSDRLADATSRHLVEAGGKRVRPTLALLAAQLGEGITPQVLDAAVVVELTHLGSLYHDDVMDSAPLRRGAPSAQTVWGNSVAILTGDLLFARASRIVADLGPEAVRIQAETFERLCIGQLHETVGPAPEDDPVAHYVQVLADKTGSLIATSARLGAMFGGCDASVQRLLVEYGERVGVAFQLADDVIDLSTDGDATGKTPGTDLREHVPTLPVLLVRRAAAGGDAVAERLVRLLDDDLSSDEALQEVLAGLRAHEALAQTAHEAKRWADAAVEALGPLPEGPVKAALSAFAGAVVSRTT
jgi:heptaprenyl diphosphate synthase